MATKYVPRRIIVACDGTGQSATRGDAAVSTNVNRFCHALENSPDAPQIVYYQSGVGTGSLGSLYQKYAGGTGLGLDDNVLDTYQFIATNYLPGDEIFLFGFSRGAFTCRILASFIMNIGLLKKSYSWELKRAYKAYMDGPAAFDRYCDELVNGYWAKKEARTRFVNIKVVGCWDTVGSVGVPDYWWSKPFRQAFEFYDASLSPGEQFPKGSEDSTLVGIENAFHALALDEVRYPFSPTLMHLPKDKDGKTMKGINLQQCWFPGVHTNIGGGYVDQNLADLTLAWMVDKCRPFLHFDQVYIDMVCKLNHSPHTIKSALRKGLSKKYPGWGMGTIYDSYRDDAMFVLGYSHRTPGEYTGKIIERQLIGETNEEMHASVRVRYAEDANFRKIKALNGFKPEQDANGRWKWVKKVGGKTVELLEAQFESDPRNFENLLRNAEYMAVAEGK